MDGIESTVRRRIARIMSDWMQEEISPKSIYRLYASKKFDVYGAVNARGVILCFEMAKRRKHKVMFVTVD